LYHYFERKIGAFKNLSDLPANEAEEVLQKIRTDRQSSQAAQRDVNYEMITRNLFIEKGGKPTREAPHYMVVEACKWLNSWYIDGCYVKIRIKEFDLNTILFIYGDMHPTFSPCK
jgi:hypothetical protein